MQLLCVWKTQNPVKILRWKENSKVKLGEKKLQVGWWEKREQQLCWCRSIIHADFTSICNRDTNTCRCMNKWQPSFWDASWHVSEFSACMHACGEVYHSLPPPDSQDPGECYSCGDCVLPEKNELVGHRASCHLLVSACHLIWCDLQNLIILFHYLCVCVCVDFSAGSWGRKSSPRSWSWSNSRGSTGCVREHASGRSVVAEGKVRHRHGACTHTHR